MVYKRLDNSRFVSVDYADTLEQLHTRLSELGKQEEALAIAQERVELYRHRSRYPYGNKLVGALKDLCGHLLKLGRQEDALVALQERVVVYRDLLLPRDLADALQDLYVCFSKLGRRDCALAVADERAHVCLHLDKHVDGKKIADTLKDPCGQIAGFSHRKDILVVLAGESALRPHQDPSSAETTHKHRPVGSVPMSFMVHDGAHHEGALSRSTVP